MESTRTSRANSCRRSTPKKMKTLNTILVLSLTSFLGCTTVSQKKTVALELAQNYSLSESSHSILFGSKTRQNRKAIAQDTSLKYFLDDVSSRSDLVFDYEKSEYKKQRVNFKIGGDYEWKELVELALLSNGFILEEVSCNTFLVRKAHSQEIEIPVT